MAQSVKTSLIIGFICLLATIIFFGLGNTLMPLFIAFAQAYLSFPVIAALEKRGIKRVYAVSVVFIVMVTVIVLLIIIILPSLIKDSRLFLQEFPQNSTVAVEKIEHMAATLGYQLDISKQGLKDFLLEHTNSDLVTSTSLFLKNLFSNFIGVLLFILNLLLIPLFFFHLIDQYEAILQKVHDLVPVPWRSKINQYTELGNRVLSGYIRGQMLVALLLAVMYSFGFALIGLRFGLLIGIVTGILSIIPYVGSIFGFTIAMIIALANFTGFSLIIGVAVVFSVVQALESFLITPKLVGGKVGLGEMATMLALIIGGNLFGLTGMILAIPVAAIIKSILQDIRVEYQSSKFYKGD